MLLEAASQGVSGERLPPRLRRLCGPATMSRDDSRSRMQRQDKEEPSGPRSAGLNDPLSAVSLPKGPVHPDPAPFDTLTAEERRDLVTRYVRFEAEIERLKKVDALTLLESIATVRKGRHQFGHAEEQLVRRLLAEDSDCLAWYIRLGRESNRLSRKLKSKDE